MTFSLWISLMMGTCFAAVEIDKTRPNRYFGDVPTKLMERTVTEQIALEPVCSKLEGNPIDDLEMYELLLSTAPDWLGDAVRRSTTANEIIMFMQFHLLSAQGGGLVGAVCFILVILFGGLCCWQWWRCCKCCRIKPPQPNNRRNLCLLAFMVLSVLGVLLAGLIAFGGFSQIINGTDVLYCKIVNFLHDVLEMVQNQTQNMSNLWYDLKSDSSAQTQLLDALSETDGIDAASAGFNAVLNAYTDSLADIKVIAATINFKCWLCEDAATSISTVQEAFNTGAFQALVSAKAQVESSLIDQAAGTQTMVNDGAGQLESFIDQIKAMDVILDLTELRDTVFILVAAVCSVLFVLSLALILCTCCAAGCCAWVDKKGELPNKSGRVRCCASLGCLYSFGLMFLIFLSCLVLQALVFALTGPCIFLWEVDGEGIGDMIGLTSQENPPEAPRMGQPEFTRRQEEWLADWNEINDEYDICMDGIDESDPETLLACQEVRYGRPVLESTGKYRNKTEDALEAEAEEADAEGEGEAEGRRLMETTMMSIPWSIKYMYQNLPSMSTAIEGLHRAGLVSTQYTERAMNQLRHLQEGEGKAFPISDLIRGIFETCIQKKEGRLMEAVKMYACPYETPGCTEDEKVPRSMEDLFVKDIITQIDEKFDGVANEPTQNMADLSSVTDLVTFAKSDVLAKVTAEPSFWTDPHWGILRYDERAAGLNIFLTSTMSLGCQDGDELVDGKTIYGLDTFLARAQVLTFGDFTNEATHTDFATRPAALGGCSAGALPSLNLQTSSVCLNDTPSSISLTRAQAAVVHCRKAADAAVAMTPPQLTTAQKTQFDTWADSITGGSTANIPELFGANADAPGRVQCHPCRAYNKLVAKINSAYFKCTKWIKKDATTGLDVTGCDPKDTTFTDKQVDAATDCAQGKDFVPDNETCVAGGVRDYMTQFGDRIKISVDRIDNGFAYFKKKLTTNLKKIVDSVFGKTLRNIANASNCDFLNRLYYGIVKGLCFRTVPGFISLEQSYLALGLLSLLLTIVCWITWLGAIHYGYYIAQAEKEENGVWDVPGAQVVGEKGTLS